MAERAVAVLPGDDLREAKAFYVDKLGFTLERRATVAGLDTLFYRRRPQ